LHQVPVSEAMITDFRSVHPDEAIAGVLERFHHGSQEDFPVISEAGLEGILTRDRILASIHDKGLSVRVSDVMDRTFVSVDPDMPLDEVYKTLLASRKTAVAVVDKGEVTGMVCLDGISRYLMFKTALSAKHSGK
jgi:CBS domain-containing protein